MTLQKNDFIEIEFIAKIKDGGVFNTNVKEELKKLNPQAEAKPFVFALGQDMFLKGVDYFLIGKEIGEYKIELTPEKAFGKRDSKFIQRMPIKVFHDQKINPVQGAAFNFDGRIAKILAVSGGRVIVDFNNPLAGKELIYNLKISKKVEDINEKINALNDFFFKKEFKFEIKDKKIILETEENMKNFVELFKDKYKDILGLDLEIKGEEEKEKKKEGSEGKKVEGKVDDK